MAIAGIPNNLYVQQANRQVYVSWDASPGATSYSVNKSTDGVNFTVLATPTVNSYLDTDVLVGTQYFYQVASVNTSGTSPYSTILSTVPTPTGEMSLGEIRLKAQQRSDLVHSNFLQKPEWNFNINQAMFELYDLLVTVYEDYFMAPGASFITSGNKQFYPLPDGFTPFLTNPVNNISFVAPPFYKLLGIDLAINTAQNASVSLNRFTFIDRNKFIYPNTASTIYGVFNLEYRIMGNQLELIPTPSSNQPLTIWYIPRLNQLLQDTDITTIGFSGWLEYVIVRAAILAMTKQQLDSSALEAQLIDLRTRIQDSAMNRDAGRPDHISDVRGNGFSNNGSGGFNGSFGGF